MTRLQRPDAFSKGLRARAGQRCTSKAQHQHRGMSTLAQASARDPMAQPIQQQRVLLDQQQQPIAAQGPIILNRSRDGTLAGAGGDTRRGVLQKAGLLAAGIAACPCCTDAALASGNAKFDYGTLSGPANWGGACAAGTRQSPIDIPLRAISASAKRLGTGSGVAGPACKPAALDPTRYKAVKPRILNTGVGTMQVRVFRVCVLGWGGWKERGLSGWCVYARVFCLGLFSFPAPCWGLGSHAPALPFFSPPAPNVLEGCVTAVACRSARPPRPGSCPTFIAPAPNP